MSYASTVETPAEPLGPAIHESAQKNFDINIIKEPVRQLAKELVVEDLIYYNKWDKME